MGCPSIRRHLGGLTSGRLFAFGVLGLLGSTETPRVEAIQQDLQNDKRFHQEEEGLNIKGQPASKLVKGQLDASSQQPQLPGDALH